MKKINLTIIVALWSLTTYAQLSGSLRAGSSTHSDDLITIDSSSPLFHYYVGVGYRFFEDEHISVIPKIIFDKSGFKNTLFFLDDNLNIIPADFTTKLYSVGSELEVEIKFFNPEKKFNVYASPFASYRKLFKSQTTIKSSIEDSKSNELLDNDKIFDWGLEVGVIYNQFKFGLFYRDILNKSSRGNSSFVITRAFGINVSYILNLKTKSKEE
ncbi:MAG: hypothetical protein RQ875_10040 [Vicingaceae bacterium]|nr:hypothetical protein [Vicingaceae bacterium]